MKYEPITELMQVAYYAPTKNKYYLVLETAIHNEAKARILQEFPRHFSQIHNTPKMQKIYERYLKDYKRKVRQEYKEQNTTRSK